MSYEEWLLTKGDQPIFYLPKFIPQTGICIPSTCSPSDVKRLLQYYLKQYYFRWTVTVVDKYCQVEKDIPISVTTVLVALVIVTLISLVVAGTTFEIMEHRKANRISRSRSIRSSTKEGASPSRRTTSSGREASSLQEDRQKRFKTCGSAVIEVLKAFSAYSNMKDLFTLEGSTAHIRSFNGIRFYSLVATIIAHTFVLSFPSNWKNFDKMDSLVKRFTTQGILHFSVCLDGIIVISGALYLMITLHKMQDLRQNFNIFQFYTHRLWRLYPAYLLNIAIIVGLMPYCGSGPRWPDLQHAIECCEKNWWTNLLFINNIVNVENLCQLHFWYIAVDFQLFLIAPIFILAFHKRPLFGWILVICLTLVSIVALAYKAYADLLNPRDIFREEITVYNLERYMYEVYFLPVSRLGSFCFGVTLGYFLHIRGNEITIKWLWHWGGLTLSVLFITSPIWLFMRYYDIPPLTSLRLVEATLCEALSRIVWVSALAFFVICFQGHLADYITKILGSLTSLECFVITARLQYAVYILHFNLLQIYFATRQRPTTYSEVQMAKIVIVVLLASHVLAVPYTLLSELPFVKLEKLIEKKLAQRKAHQAT